MAGASGGGNARRTGASARRATKGRSTRAAPRAAAKSPAGRGFASSRGPTRAALKPKKLAARFTTKKMARGGRR